MVDYTIVNGTNAELTNVNATGNDVSAYSIASNIALDGTELAAVIDLGGVAVMKDAQTYQQKREAAKVLKHRKETVF